MGLGDYGQYFTGREVEPIFGNNPLAQQAQQYSATVAKAEEEARLKKQQEADAIEYNKLEAEARAAGRPVFAWRGSFAPVRPGPAPSASSINPPPFQPGGMSTGAPEDFNPMTQGAVSTPIIPPSATGPAASIEPPSAPGRIARGPNGEVMLTNLADYDKPLGLEEAKAEVAKSGPMRFSSDASGRVDTLTPGGAGGYSYGGDLPDLSMTYEQMKANKDFNPGQQQLWIEEKNKAFEQAMKAAAVEKMKAEAFGLNAQGGLFGEQAAGLKQRREMTPEESAYRESTIPLLDYVTKNVDRYAPLIAPKVDNIYIAMLAADPKMAAQAAKNPAAKQQMREAAKAAAIQQFVQENQQQLMRELMRSGMYQPGLS